MRKTLLSLAALVMTLAASAQGLQAPRFGGAVQKAQPAGQATQARKVPFAKADLAANQRLIGYYTTDDVDNAIGVGNYTTEPIEPGALLVPSDYASFMGAKVVGIRFAMGPNATATKVAVYTMQGTTMTDLMSQDINIVSTTPSDYSRYVWNTVIFDEAKQFTLSNDYDGLMATYTVTQASQTYPVGLNSSVNGRDLYINCNIPASAGGSGKGWYSFGSDYGALAIQLIVEGDFPSNGVAPTDFGNFSVGAGKTKTVPVTFNNLGSSLRNFTYSVTLDGMPWVSNQTVTLNTPLGVGGSYTTNLTFNAPDEPGTYPLVLTVDQVNGETNGAETKSANGTMVVVEKEFNRGVVMEEFTGTGCGYCPRGLVGMKHMAEQFPENFIGIGIHQYNSSDPMYNGNYASLGFNGAPSCILDRTGETIDPYYGSNNGIANDIQARLDDLPMLGITVSGTYNADSTQIAAKAIIDPLISGTYEMAYAITADGVGGAGSSWGQSNYYSSYPESQAGGDEDLAAFCSGGEYGKSSVTGYKFNDVLIGSSYKSTGNTADDVTLAEGSILNTSMDLDVTNSTKTALKAALDYDKIYIIAMVIDRATGKIMNAAKAKVQGYDTTGIESVNASNETSAPEAIYSVSGQRSDKMQRGLNIVKLANGKTVKVIVK